MSYRILENVTEFYIENFLGTEVWLHLITHSLKYEFLASLVWLTTLFIPVTKYNSSKLKENILLQIYISKLFR